MFGKLIIEVDKSSVFSAIAFVGASCACIMVCNGLDLIIRGGKGERHPRFKGFLLLTIGLALLAGSIITLLKSDVIIKKMMTLLSF